MLDVPCRVLRGEALTEHGLGGLLGVGRAASCPPALVVLGHEPAGAARTVAWVGKGVVFDTGGLGLKSLREMQGMKGDMAGAAAVLGAFAAAVRLGAPDRLFALLCVAENAVGPGAVRPDDVLTLGSGRTVEVTNPDAEGRLALADGVAWAVRELGPDVLVDLGTLTDGAVTATGRRHAAIVCNDDALEARAVEAGRATGDLVHPLPYCPELFREALASEVADMTNAARDHRDADASCAAQFVAEHLGRFRGPWLHVDMDGPSRGRGGRGTGFGVALLLRLFGYL
jgi:probable aminopeptidase NPEPL1